MKKITRFLLFFFLFSLAGCTSKLSELTIVSSRNVDVGAKYEKIGQGEASSRVFVIVLPLGTPDIEEAIDKILDEENGDLLTNVVIESYNHSFILGTKGYKVKGDVWKRAGYAITDNSKQYYQLTESGGNLFLVPVDNSSKIIKVRKEE